MSDSDKLRDRQTNLVKILEAIDLVLKTSGWQTLKELVFDKVVERIERQLLSESKQFPIDADKIYTLQGELVWAKRYADFKAYAEMLQKELQGIKDNLK